MLSTLRQLACPLTSPLLSTTSNSSVSRAVFWHSDCSFRELASHKANRQVYRNASSHLFSSAVTANKSHRRFSARRVRTRLPVFHHRARAERRIRSPVPAEIRRSTRKFRRL